MSPLRMRSIRSTSNPPPMTMEVMSIACPTQTYVSACESV